MSAVSVPLTRGLVALIDEADADAVLPFKWRSMRTTSGLAYAVRAVPTGLARPRQRALYLHTFLTGFARTDHIDGDGLNDQRANLRSATILQNNLNRASHRGSTSRFKGVGFNAGRGPQWKAGVKVDGHSRHLGYHASEEGAARAYDTAARELFGEFATLNFPRPGERSALVAT